MRPRGRHGRQEPQGRRGEGAQPPQDGGPEQDEGARPDHRRPHPRRVPGVQRLRHRSRDGRGGGHREPPHQELQGRELRGGGPHDRRHRREGEVPGRDGYMLRLRRQVQEGGCPRGALPGGGPLRGARVRDPGSLGLRLRRLRPRRHLQGQRALPEVRPRHHRRRGDHSLRHGVLRGGDHHPRDDGWT